MSNRVESFLSNTAKVGQLVFYIIIAGTAIYNLYIANRQSKLIFKPVVGVVEVKTTRHVANLSEGSKASYDSVRYATVAFVIKNVGNLPAKNLKTLVRGKLGDTNLAYTEKNKDKPGVVLIQNAEVTNRARISKSTLETLLKKKKRLIYTVKISYTDWEEYNNYDYSTSYEVTMIRKEPLTLKVIAVETTEG